MAFDNKVLNFFIGLGMVFIILVSQVLAYYSDKTCNLLQFFFLIFVVFYVSPTLRAHECPPWFANILLHSF